MQQCVTGSKQRAGGVTAVSDRVSTNHSIMDVKFLRSVHFFSSGVTWEDYDQSVSNLQKTPFLNINIYLPSYLPNYLVACMPAYLPVYVST